MNWIRKWLATMTVRLSFVACRVWRSTRKFQDAVALEIKQHLWHCHNLMKWHFSVVSSLFAGISHSINVCYHRNVLFSHFHNFHWPFVSTVDYRFLEDTGRFADGATRDNLVQAPRVTVKVSPVLIDLVCWMLFCFKFLGICEHEFRMEYR